MASKWRVVTAKVVYKWKCPHCKKTQERNSDHPFDIVHTCGPNVYRVKPPDKKILLKMLRKIKTTDGFE